MEGPEISQPPIACSLSSADVPERLADWKSALGSVLSRQPIPGGLRLALAPAVSLAHLVDLVVAEQQCCPFFCFAITVDARGPALEVTAPPQAQELVSSLFAAP